MPRRAPLALLPALLLIAFLLGLVSSCGSETPEDTLRALIADAASAAEDRDAGAILDHVSDAYVDQSGQNKRSLRGALLYLFREHQRVHVFTRIREIELPQADHARVVVAVALAGTPIDSPSALDGLDADVLLFELAFFREGDDEWRVTRASWSPASASDFL